MHIHTHKRMHTAIHTHIHSIQQITGVLCSGDWAEGAEGTKLQLKCAKDSYLHPGGSSVKNNTHSEGESGVRRYGLCFMGYVMMFMRL